MTTKCDLCGRWSRTYDRWPTCRECSQDICTDCDVPSERTEDEDHKTLCLVCVEQEKRHVSA